ncbi:hypothetical protein HNR12_003211 [Streptomonospora nanhaiensis]|uniref:PH domain-containing protein n=1 Tax=Streptomonospora nanhaiensis TaxID=1323731 RepID=A0A853BQ59_9ACTN|nr:hypothetical protein [Streptomonospora nanhaiensis]NYI96934.1 hypothetical protein [Streptomonospora nanhaiensis]
MPPFSHGAPGPIWRPAPGGWPVPGQAGAQVLRPSAGAADYLRFLLGYLPLLAALFVVVLLLGAVFFETAAEGTGTAGGIAVGLLVVVPMAAHLVWKLRRMFTGTAVVVSPRGVELRDSLGFEVRLAWTDVVAVDTVVDRFSPARGVRLGDRADPGAPVVRAPEFRSRGLIGWGERVVPARAPRFVRRRLAAQPRDLATGRFLVAVGFGAAGAAGPDNPLLRAARHHRPDLFPRFPQG